MKKSIRVLMFVVVLSAVLLSACGGAVSTPSPAAAKVEAAEVAFTGVIESMNGTQWVVNGQTVTVDPAVVQNGPFKVGDTVKVEAKVAADGSVTVTRVETPSAQDLAIATVETPSGTPDTSIAGTPITPQVGGGQGGLVFDNSGSEAYGPVDAITADTVTIGGQIFRIANSAEFKNQIQAGNFVKVHFILNADGSMSITEIATWDPALVGGDNSNLNGNTNDDNSNSDNSNGGNSNSNDDNSNGDDHGGNSNDDDHDDNSNGNGNDG